MNFDVELQFSKKFLLTLLYESEDELSALVKQTLCLNDRFFSSLLLHQNGKATIGTSRLLEKAMTLAICRFTLVDIILSL